MKTGKKLLYLIFILAVITKLAVGLLLTRGPLGPEVFEYEQIADNILGGKGFTYNFLGVEYKALIQPFYPVFTAFVYYFTNHSQAVLLCIQAVISSLLCFIIYSIAMKLTGKREALLAALIVAFHPGMIVYSVLKLHTLVFDALFFLLTVSLILKFMEKPSDKNALLAGIIIGFAMLSRSTILIFVVFSMVYLFFRLRNIKKIRRARHLFIIIFSAILVYSPWIIRNYNVFGKFVFMQTITGENLWAGNNENASGSAILDSGKSVHKMMPKKMREDLSKLDELGQNKYYKDYFFNFVKEKPLLFAQLFVKKFYYFWWFAPHTGALYERLWLHIYKIYYAVLFIFFLMGLAYSLRDKTKIYSVSILLAYMLSLALLHATVNIDTRHRWTVEPIMIIFSSIGFFKILGDKNVDR